MRENICTIPINDIFEHKRGCPICRIHSMIEKQYVEFIVGDAMMEPSVRVEVNSTGFCPRHFEQMLERGSRLPVALMLETHLEYIRDKFLSGSNAKKQAESLAQMSNSCFVCKRIDKSFELMLQSLLEHWHKDEEFRRLYREQEYICARHCAQLLERGSKSRKMRSAERAEFCKDTLDLTKTQLSLLKNDISYFCKMYDYRNRGGDWGNSKDAIERSIAFLNS